MMSSWDNIKDGVTPNDIYTEGFLGGLHFAFFMTRNELKKSLTDKDLVRLAHWFELKGPGCDFARIYQTITSALCLDDRQEE